MRSPSEDGKKKKNKTKQPTKQKPRENKTKIHKLETYSKFPCTQEQKQLDTYCTFIKGVSPATKPQLITTCINDRRIESISSKTLNACGAASVRLWRAPSLAS